MMVCSYIYLFFIAANGSNQWLKLRRTKRTRDENVYKTSHEISRGENVKKCVVDTETTIKIVHCHVHG